MPSFPERVEFEGSKALADSPLAVLCEIGETRIWIPQSQIDDDSEVSKKGDEGTLIVSEWIAIQKGLV